MPRMTKWMGAVILAAGWTAARAAEPPSPATAPAQGLMESLKKEVMADPMAAPALQKYAVEVLLPQCVNPVFVRAIKEQNAKKMTLDKIKAIDQEWMNSGSTTPFKTAILATPASKEIQRIAQKDKAVREAFVMDDQGGVVGETNVTSDYWQGDEKKWTESFKGGKGAAFIDVAQFDASARVVLQQISLPIWDEGGRVVGAVTWGIVLDKINWKDAPPPPQ